MKTTHLFYGITVFFFVILTWLGSTADIFRHPPVEDMPTRKQHVSIVKPSARQKKKNCHCCTESVKKLKQIIEDSFAEGNFAQKQAEKQASVVSDSQR